MKESKESKSRNINLGRLAQDIYWSCLPYEAVEVGSDYILLKFPTGNEYVEISADRVLYWRDKDEESEKVYAGNAACNLISRWCDHWEIAFGDFAERLIEELKNE